MASYLAPLYRGLYCYSARCVINLLLDLAPPKHLMVPPSKEGWS